MNHPFFVIIMYLSFIVSSFGATLVSDLINEDGSVTETVIEILGHAGVRIEGAPEKEEWPPERAQLNSTACEEVTTLIQGRNSLYPSYSWMRPGDKERWSLSCDLPQANSSKILDLVFESSVSAFKGLNMGSASYPISKDFDGILYLGATLGVFEERVKALNLLIDLKEINIKVPSTRLYILSGKRRFNEKEKGYLLSQNNKNLLEVDNESEGMVWVFHNHSHPFLKSINIEVIDDKFPEEERATTKSTAELFFREIKPKDSERYLLVSSHMFTLYQYLIIKRTAYLEGYEGVHFEMCSHARKAHDSSSNLQSLVAQVLDNLSRIFYEISEYKKLTGDYPS